MNKTTGAHLDPTARKVAQRPEVPFATRRNGSAPAGRSSADSSRTVSATALSRVSGVEAIQRWNPRPKGSGSSERLIAQARIVKAPPSSRRLHGLNSARDRTTRETGRLRSPFGFRRSRRWKSRCRTSERLAHDIRRERMEFSAEIEAAPGYPVGPGKIAGKVERLRSREVAARPKDWRRPTRLGDRTPLNLRRVRGRRHLRRGGRLV